MSDDRFGCLTMMVCVSCCSRTAWSSRFKAGSSFFQVLVLNWLSEPGQKVSAEGTVLTYLISYSRCDEAFEICSLTILESFDHLKVVFLFNAMMLIYCFKGRSVLCLSFWLQDTNWKVQGILGSWMAASKESRERSRKCFYFLHPVLQELQQKDLLLDQVGWCRL